LRPRGVAIPHVDLAAGKRAVEDAIDSSRGDPIRSAASVYDWDRLDRAVRALVAQQEALRKEVCRLREDMGDRNLRIRTLEAQLLEANQRRQDTIKRIDELIAQLDQLDVQLATAEPSA
jgi:uncharacterized protein involved in exopolysaccharide biosynthesis